MPSLFRRTAVPLLALVVLAACGDDPIGPRTAEDVTFDASLGVNLAAMTELPTGVYIQTLQEGEGVSITTGSVTLDYTLWVSDGTQVEQGTFTFVLGAGQAIAGFNDGVSGMKVGETRLIVIPSEQGYGARDQPRIPPHSVLVFRATLTSAGEGGDTPT